MELSTRSGFEVTRGKLRRAGSATEAAKEPKRCEHTQSGTGTGPEPAAGEQRSALVAADLSLEALG